MRYLFVTCISYASCNLPYRRRNVQQVMSCRAVAHDVYLALLVVMSHPLESRRGVEIDFCAPLCREFRLYKYRLISLAVLSARMSRLSNRRFSPRRATVGHDATPAR